jgi:hypothetical protein
MPRSEAVRALLMARADVLARNFEGEQPHRLAEAGSQIWRALVGELGWRAALEAPRTCHYVDAGALARCLFWHHRILPLYAPDMHATLHVISSWGCSLWGSA